MCVNLATATPRRGESLSKRPHKKSRLHHGYHDLCHEHKRVKFWGKFKFKGENSLIYVER